MHSHQQVPQKAEPVLSQRAELLSASVRGGATLGNSPVHDQLCPGPHPTPLLCLLSGAQAVTLLSLRCQQAGAGAYFIHLPFAVSSRVI